MAEQLDGYTVIYHVKLDKDRFWLTESQAKMEDLAEEYAVCASPKSNAGLLVYAKYNGEWQVNPWTVRFLVRDLLEQIGIVIPV